MKQRIYFCVRLISVIIIVIAFASLSSGKWQRWLSSLRSSRVHLVASVYLHQYSESREYLLFENGRMYLPVCDSREDWLSIESVATKDPYLAGRVRNGRGVVVCRFIKNCSSSLHLMGGEDVQYFVDEAGFLAACGSIGVDATDFATPEQLRRR